MRYRRASIPGATYFFTVNLADRKSNLLIDHIEQLRDSVRKVRSAHPFESIAWVVLPDHMHAIWILFEAERCAESYMLKNRGHEESRRIGVRYK